MTNSEHLELIIELWSLFEPQISAKNRMQLAEQFLKIFEENGIYVDEMLDLPGHNRNLDKALEILYPRDDDEELDDE